MNLEIEKIHEPKKSFRQQKRWTHELRFGKIKHNRPVNVIVDGRLEERLKFIQKKKKRWTMPRTSWIVMRCIFKTISCQIIPGNL